MARNLVYLTLFGCLVLFQNIWSLSNDVYIKPNPKCGNINVPDCKCCRELVKCQEGACGGQCITGIYGNKCFNDCPINCEECKDPYNPTGNTSLWGVANCTSCQAGYYSTSEYFQCQFNCTTGCATCTSATDCTSCKDGYYRSGTSCYDCSIGCLIHNQCNPQDGSCKCKHGFAGDRCDHCAPNIRTYPICDQCMTGFYGTECKQTCPVNCNDSLCDRNNGICTKGCYGNFAGDNCTSCITGWRGTECDLKCPENCDVVCDQFTGYCESCKSNFAGHMCTSCLGGFYGNACNSTCPSNCERDVCHRISGHCTNCIPGFSGDRCCLNGSSCQSCSLDSACFECVPGAHGEDCDQECPKNCADRICHKVNGTCVACVGGFQGAYCTLAPIGSGPGVPVAAIAGGVSGGVVAILAVAILISIFYRRRSSNKNNGPKAMVRTDGLTTDRVYANDAAIVAASNECNIYETLTGTNNTITDYEPLSLGAFFGQDKTRPITVGIGNRSKSKKQTQKHKTGLINKMDTSDKANTSPIQDKSLKPEMGLTACKFHKAAGVSKMSQQPVVPRKEEHHNDYYNTGASLEQASLISGFASFFDRK